MSTRPFIALVVSALALRPFAVVAAQDTSAAAATQDTAIQGYAPAEAPPAPDSTPAPAPAATAVPAGAPTTGAAAPVATPAPGSRAAALSSLGFV